MVDFYPSPLQILNSDHSFIRQSYKWAYDNKNREGSGLCVCGGGGGGPVVKNWAHLNKFTAGAAQSSSRGMTSQLENVWTSLHVQKREKQTQTYVHPHPSFPLFVPLCRAKRGTGNTLTPSVCIVSWIT